MKLPDFAHRLIAAERCAGDATDSEARAAFRVCDRLRESLSVLTGVRGFRALLERALAGAKAEAPCLAAVEVKPDGSLLIPAGLEAEAGPAAAAKGAAALVIHLLQLLATFIGEALTIRLAQQAWPKLAREHPKTEGKT